MFSTKIKYECLGNSDALLSDNFKVSTIELEGDNDLLEVQLDFDKFCPYMEEGASSSTSLQESQKPEASENLVEITLNGGVLAVRDMTLQRLAQKIFFIDTTCEQFFIIVTTTRSQQNRLPIKSVVQGRVMYTAIPIKLLFVNIYRATGY